jgi:hypothetical protein
MPNNSTGLRPKSDYLRTQHNLIVATHITQIDRSQRCCKVLDWVALASVLSVPLCFKVTNKFTESTVEESVLEQQRVRTVHQRRLQFFASGNVNDFAGDETGIQQEVDGVAQVTWRTGPAKWD